MLGWLRNLFVAGKKRKPIAFSFTDEELEAIRKQGDEINSLTPQPGQVFYVRNELVNPLKALALVKHVARQIAILNKLPKEQIRPLLDKAIATQAKACALHELPYYFFLWASLTKVKGDTETAKRLFGVFLKSQAQFKPRKGDRFIIGLLEADDLYHVEKAVVEARKAIDHPPG